MANYISIILPARNESASLRGLLPKLVNSCDGAEIIVVDDGSDDDTCKVCEEFDVTIIRHPYPKGNGAAIKSGARVASGEIIIFMDADGQHLPEDLMGFIREIDKGYDMVVGSRKNNLHASLPRYCANLFYNWLASWMTGHKIQDLTSGFRAVRADKFKEFLHLLPNGFSYPTSITMAFFRAGYSVRYIPININKRLGNSHIRPIRDGLRFLLIIFRVGTLYTPLKFFVPISIIFFIFGVSNYAYTFITQGRFTNMSALFFVASTLIFLIGLVSEQLTILLYSDRNINRNQ
jgi:glycosyltransferase involved in cell wall biosynthesis